jgi:hypothetical protein
MGQFTPSKSRFAVVLVMILLAMPLGCYNTPLNVERGPAPLREPGPGQAGNCCYEDSLQGQHIFEMYCGTCHNFRSLAERPFSNYQNVVKHMRVRANLTGKEEARLLEWMRRWHDIPMPGQHDTPSPKRFFFSQPIPELKDKQARTGKDPVSGPRAGATDEASPGQPPPGTGPMQAR